MEYVSGRYLPPLSICLNHRDVEGYLSSTVDCVCATSFLMETKMELPLGHDIKESFVSEMAMAPVLTSLAL